MSDISLTKICSVFPFEKKLEMSEIFRGGGEVVEYIL